MRLKAASPVIAEHPGVGGCAALKQQDWSGCGREWAMLVRSGFHRRARLKPRGRVLSGGRAFKAPNE